MPPDPLLPLPVLEAGAFLGAGAACWGALVLVEGRGVGAGEAEGEEVDPAPVLAAPVPPPVAPPPVAPLPVAVEPTLVGELAATAGATAAAGVVFATGTGAG